MSFAQHMKKLKEGNKELEKLLNEFTEIKAKTDLKGVK